MKEIRITQDSVTVNGEKVPPKEAKMYRRLMAESYHQYEHPEEYPKDKRDLLKIIGSIYSRSGK